MAVISGNTSPAFASVGEALRKQLARTPGGGALCVYHRGEKVVDLWGGVRDRAGNAWQADTLAVSFSTSKGVTATLAHQLAAEGLLDYDAPVADYWPEFAANGKGEISIRELLTHRAGLYGMRDLGLEFDDLSNWTKVTSALAAAPANRSQAPASLYHALTWGWLVGEVIQRISNTPISELVQTRLAHPLHLDGLYIGTPDSEHHRVAELLMGRDPNAPAPVDTPRRRARRRLRRGLLRGYRGLSQVGLLPDLSAFEDSVSVPGFHPQKMTQPHVLRAAIPSAGGVFSARALARLYGALACGGALDGQRIMDAAHVELLSEQQVFSLDRALYAPMRWRLGYHQPFVLRRRRPPRAFGHFGYGGSGAWADPDHQLAVALTVNAGTGTPWGDMRILKVGAEALRCAEKVGRRKSDV